ncbi:MULTISPECIES: ROK family transcriptional regulator [unclassified Microbacterium]|uniref:ROK family transcriptional regulator n=1 Tax=unclassified Microbacterium TaxID=2609290 RepID=UPI0012FC2777|nr:ROK family transcriptional regulator [Microbacterium sp. MAH-37]MVQ44073.1 ROK family protein [Microbacterium sp. MAH-37]
MNDAIATTALRGGNLPHLADFNETIVLEAIRRATDGCSRVELARVTGLSGQTITNITRRLLARELIHEAGRTAPAGVGKPRTLLRLNARGAHAVGVHIDPASITYVLLDFHGRPVAHTSHRTPSVTDVQPVLDEITAHVESLISDSGVDRDRVIGVGIASPGPIDVVNGVVLNPPLLPGWVNVPLRDHLQEQTGLPTIMDKDVIAGVVAEQWAADAEHSRNFAFVYIGTGIGVGLVLDGHVVRGTSNNIGDIGLMPVSTTGDAGESPREFAALGAVASAHVVMRQAARRGILPADFGEVQPAEAAAAFRVLRALADGGSPSAREMLVEMAQYLASGILTITNLLDLDRVLLGGPIWRELAPYALDVIGAEVDRRTVTGRLHEVTVSGTSLGDQVAAIGAGCLVLDQHFAPRFAPDTVRA